MRKGTISESFVPFMPNYQPTTHIAMKKTLICLALLFAFSCNKKPTAADVEARLKRTMSEYLYQSVKNDSSKVKYEVKEVIYFKDVDFYECEFKVNMLQPGHDTSGVMKAKIAKDFSKVIRKS